MAWFRLEDGQWIGEWQGVVPSPPLSLLAQRGDAREMGMNAWLHDTQRLITPSGSPYDVQAQCWDHDAWEDCPSGGAVCVDVTRFQWPVGDQSFHRWNTMDGGIEYPDTRQYIQVDRNSQHIDANQVSSRPIRSTAQKAILDITGTALAPFHGLLTGHFTNKHGRWMLVGAPEHVSDGIQHALDTTFVDISATLVPQKALTA